MGFASGRDFDGGLRCVAQSGDEFPGTFGKRAAARQNHVEAAPQRFGAGDFERAQLAAPEFIDDRDLWEKGQAKFAQDHSLAGFDGLDFQDDVRQ